MPRKVIGMMLGTFTCAALAAACGGGSTSRPTTAGTTAPAPSTSVSTTTVPRPKPYDPTKPIDLGGTPGVTAVEQRRAENLLRATIVALRKYASPAEAQAAGYRSIGDSVTGDEHYVKWSYVDDGDTLDPQRPESLVYEFKNGKQSVVAAMYMMPLGSRFSNVPDVGGALTQWHVHSNLCLTDDPEQKLVSGITSPNGKCPPGTSKAGNTPMLHAWIVPNECGPFAALEGIGAGQVPEGQTRLCDTAHGAPRS